MTNILILTFNRSAMFGTLLDSIPEGAGTIFVSCDGARKGNISDAHEISLIKTMVNKYSQNPIFSQFLDDNHGCRRGVISGINWFFDNVSEGIILEDDIQLTSEFLDFASYSLREFRADQRIGMVCATSLFTDLREGFESPFCSQFPSVWGWATWADRWSDYDPQCPDLQRCQNVYDSVYNKYGFGANSYELIRAATTGKIDTWDYQLTHMLIRTGRFALLPPSNLVSNIGFHNQATHTTNSHSLLSKLSVASDYSVTTPFKPFFGNQGKYIEYLKKVSFFSRLGYLGRIMYGLSNK